MKKIWGSLKANNYISVREVGVSCFSIQIIQWVVVFREKVNITMFSEENYVPKPTNCFRR